MSAITVIKRDILGRETWRYRGNLLHQEPERIVLEAFFDREDMEFHGMPLRKGDRFIETYYTDRWFNVLEIHAREDDRLRGWYCNISQPAEIDGNQLSYVDLALDLLVFPDGIQVVLDTEEFARLELTDWQRNRAWDALKNLQAQFKGVTQ